MYVCVYLPIYYSASNKYICTYIYRAFKKFPNFFFAQGFKIVVDS